MELRVVEHSDSLTHVAIAGRLDVAGVQAVEIKFLGFTAARGKPTIVDLSGVTFIASMGIGMLMGAAKALKRHGASMVLLRPQEMVESVMLAASLDTAIPIAHELEQARSMLMVP